MFATDRFKLIRFYGKDVPNGEEFELYDLKTDPGEMKNCYANPEYAAKVSCCRRLTASDCNSSLSLSAPFKT